MGQVFNLPLAEPAGYKPAPRELIRDNSTGFCVEASRSIKRRYAHGITAHSGIVPFAAEVFNPQIGDGCRLIFRFFHYGIDL